MIIETLKGICADCEEVEYLVYVEAADARVCTFCYENYKTCSACEERHHEEEMKKDAHGNGVCAACVNDTYQNCHECEELYHTDELYHHSESMNEYCEDCWCRIGLNNPPYDQAADF